MDLQSLRRFQILRRLARCVFAWVSRKYCKHLLIFDFRLRGDHAPGAAERPRIVRPLLVCCLGRKSCSSVAVISMRLKTTPTSTRNVWDTSRNPTTSATNSGSPGRERFTYAPTRACAETLGVVSMPTRTRQMCPKCLGTSVTVQSRCPI